MSNSFRFFTTEELLERLDPRPIYAWLGGISLFLLVILVPPFQAPDEPQHFFRSYQLSTLEVSGRVQDGALGSDLPASLPDLVYRFMGTNAVHMDYRPRPIHRLSDTFEEFKRPLDSGRTIFVNYSTVNYPPTSYIPQALAIAAGRSVGVGPLGLYYMGRFANALVCALITWFTISR